MGFPEEQAAAWQQIISLMIEDPRNVILNGSFNGPGSSIENTETLRSELPKLLRRHHVDTLLDVPCGDLNWITQTDLHFLFSYIGMDVEPRLIDADRKNWRDKRCVFICANLLTRKRLPNVDCILCRDYLMCLTDEYLMPTLQKFKASGSRWLLASNYPGRPNTYEYHPEKFPFAGYLERPYDLTAPPFNMTRIDGITEQQAPSGLISQPHELALFDLSGWSG